MITFIAREMIEDGECNCYFALKCLNLHLPIIENGLIESNIFFIFNIDKKFPQNVPIIKIYLSI
jgi:hypothetical protein